MPIEYAELKCNYELESKSSLICKQIFFQFKYQDIDCARIQLLLTYIKDDIKIKVKFIKIVLS